MSSESGSEITVDSLLQHILPCLLNTTVLTDAPTNNLPTTHLILTNGCFAGIWRWTAFGHNYSTSWRQWTSWWVCQITHETTEFIYSYLPLLPVNCYCYLTPVVGTIVDVWDIVTPMMHYDVRSHLLFVYIGLNCASLSVVVVFEAEQSYCWISSLGCGTIMLWKVSTHWGIGDPQGH